jgi:hypothetical protein
MTQNQDYHGVVEKIIPEGKHCPYVVARVEGLGSVTFSLDKEVWQEEDWPEPGTCVMLSKVRKKRAGWRAQQARFIEPSDEQQQQDQKGASR